MVCDEELLVDRNSGQALEAIYNLGEGKLIPSQTIWNTLIHLTLYNWICGDELFN